MNDAMSPHRYGNKGRLLAEPPPLPQVIDVIRGLLLEPISALVEGRPFTMKWPPGGQWRTSS